MTIDHLHLKSIDYWDFLRSGYIILRQLTAFCFRVVHNYADSLHIEAGLQRSVAFNSKWLLCNHVSLQRNSMNKYE